MYSIASRPPWVRMEAFEVESLFTLLVDLGFVGWRQVNSPNVFGS